jgi:hypothetical protein
MRTPLSESMLGEVAYPFRSKVKGIFFMEVRACLALGIMGELDSETVPYMTQVLAMLPQLPHPLRSYRTGKYHLQKVSWFLPMIRAIQALLAVQQRLLIVTMSEGCLK